MKNVKKDVLNIILLVSISGFIWRHIPSLQFQGEGFYYFMTLLDSYLSTKSNYDTFALSFFKLIGPIFKDQVHLYMWFQFITILLIDLSMYILIRLLTESRLTGLITALLFSTSFIGKFDMFSGGNYQYFVQRGMLLLFLLPALFFFILYFQQKFLLKYYILGLLFFLLSISMGFFATWFLPIFSIYPITYLLINFNELKRTLWKVIWTPLPFVIGNMLIINQSTYVPQESIFDFVLNKFFYVITGILQQLTVLTFPIGELFFQFKKQSIEYFVVLGLTLFLYCYIFFTNFKIQKELKILQATAILSAIAMLLFNIYIQAAETLNTFGSTRYFYYPFVMISIFWGISLATILKKQNFLIPLIILFTFWFVYNNIHIQKRLKNEEWIYKANRNTIEILRRWAPETKNKPSYVYLPASLGGYGGDFAYQFYSHPEGDFDMEGLDVLDLDKLSKSGLSSENLYVLHFDPISKNVVDKTKEARSKLIELQKIGALK